jgi:hypothetical protein
MKDSCPGLLGAFAAESKAVLEPPAWDEAGFAAELVFAEVEERGFRLIGR